MDIEFALEEFDYDEFKKEFRNIVVRDMKIRETTGATIIAYKEKSHNFIFNPPAEVTISQNDVFKLLGNHENLKRFREEYIER